MELKEIVHLITQRLEDDQDLDKFCADHANELIGERRTGGDWSDEMDERWFSIYNQAFLNVLIRIAADGCHFTK